MAELESQELLRVRLERATLSLGGLGLLLQDLQAGLRATATVIDKRPPERSLRVSRIDQGSLEILVEAIRWTAQVADLAGRAFAEVANAVRQNADLSVQVAIVLYLLQSRGQRAHEEEEGTRHEELAGHLKELDKRPQRLVQRRVVQEVAQRLNMTPQQVEAVTVGQERIERSVDRIGRAGGGTIEAPITDQKATIPNGFRARRHRSTWVPWRR